MVQLKFLSGNKAGTSWVARHFPVRIGRSPGNDLQLDDRGIWDDHLAIQLKRGQGFIIETFGGALAMVNTQPVTEPMVLHNGDTLEVGAARLQFWLAAPRQRALALREWLTWIALGAVSLSQIGLIYFVLD